MSDSGSENRRCTATPGTGCAAVDGTKRSFDGSSSERIRVIPHETSIINVKFGSEGAEQAFVAITTI